MLNPLRSLTLAAVAALGAGSAQAQSCMWHAGAPCPEPRFEGVPQVIDGKLWVFGGFNNAAIQATDRVDVFDPQTGSWSPASPMPIVNTHIGLVKDDRKLWMVGGFEGNHPGTAIAAVWTYDIDLDQWSPGPALPGPVAAGGCTILGRELHYFGGVLSDRDTDTGEHWMLDLDNTAAGWVARAPLPEPRNHLVGVAFNGRAHAIGGQNRHDTNPVDTAFHHVYDPLTDIWSTAASLPFPRSHFEPGTFVLNGEIVITGGKSLPTLGQNLPDVSAYDPVNDSWRNLPPLVVSTFGAASQVIGQDWIVTAGAINGVIPQATTWIRDKDAFFPGGMPINVGGPYHSSFTTAIDWCADTLAQNGAVFTNSNITQINGTSDLPVYRNQRVGSGSTADRLNLRVPADNGLNRVRLHFAEIQHGATGFGGPSVGQRVFDVVLENHLALNDLDVAAAVGVETVLTREFDVFVEDGAIDVFLRSEVGEPALAAFQVLPQPNGNIERFCATNANSSGIPAVIDVSGSISVQQNNLWLWASPVPNNFGLFFYGQSPTQVPFGNGIRCVAQPLVRLPPNIATINTLRRQVNLNTLPPAGAIAPGSTWHFQAWFRDPFAGGSNSNSSDGIRILFTP